MQVIKNSLNAFTYEVTIKESTSEMEHYKKQAAKKLSESRQFTGFRKGDEVPVDVVIREIGEERLMSESLEIALQSLYPKALKKLDIHPIEVGELQKVNSMSPLEVVLNVEIMPEVKIDIKKIEKIHIDIAEVSVSDEELQKEMDAMIVRGTHYHTRGAHHGHHHDENGDVADEMNVAIQIEDKVRLNAI